MPQDLQPEAGKTKRVLFRNQASGRWWMQYLLTSSYLSNQPKGLITLSDCQSTSKPFTQRLQSWRKTESLRNAIIGVDHWSHWHAPCEQHDTAPGLTPSPSWICSSQNSPALSLSLTHTHTYTSPPPTYPLSNSFSPPFFPFSFVMRTNTRGSKWDVNHVSMPNLPCGRGWTSEDISWRLEIPATQYYVSGTDLLRQVHVLPHWHTSCTSNLLSHPVTGFWHQANLSQHWPNNYLAPGRIATRVPMPYHSAIKEEK